VASFLDGMAGAIFAGFKGQLRKGVIRRLGPGAGGLDGHGRPQQPVPTLSPLEGFVDDYSDFTRAQAGIPAHDRRVNIFGASLPPGFTPRKDDMVRLDYPAANGAPARAEWYQLRERIMTDPAKALWLCQSFETGAPSDVG